MSIRDDYIVSDGVITREILTFLTDTPGSFISHLRSQGYIKPNKKETIIRGYFYESKAHDSVLSKNPMCGYTAIDEPRLAGTDIRPPRAQRLSDISDIAWKNFILTLYKFLDIDISLRCASFDVQINNFTKPSQDVEIVGYKSGFHHDSWGTWCPYWFLKGGKPELLVFAYTQNFMPQGLGLEVRPLSTGESRFINIKSPNYHSNNQFTHIVANNTTIEHSPQHPPERYFIDLPAGSNTRILVRFHATPSMSLKMPAEPPALATPTPPPRPPPAFATPTPPPRTSPPPGLVVFSSPAHVATPSSAFSTSSQGPPMIRNGEFGEVRYTRYGDGPYTSSDFDKWYGIDNQREWDQGIRIDEKRSVGGAAYTFQQFKDYYGSIKNALFRWNKAKRSGSSAKKKRTKAQNKKYMKKNRTYKKVPKYTIFRERSNLGGKKTRKAKEQVKIILGSSDDPFLTN